MTTPKEITLHDVLDFIQDPDLELDHRRRIVEALNSQVKASRRQAKAGLHPGMRVTFLSNRTGRMVVGRDGRPSVA